MSVRRSRPLGHTNSLAFGPFLAFWQTPGMEHPPDVELIASELVHTGRVFDLRRETVRLPSGLVQTLDAIDHPGAVAVAARNADGELLVVRQYRHATGNWLTEIPAGRLEPDEAPLAAAQRELEEETGYRAENWRLARTFFVAPGFCSERVWLFTATDCYPVPGGGLSPDEDEELAAEWVDPRALLSEEKVGDAKTILAAQWALSGREGR